MRGKLSMKIGTLAFQQVMNYGAALQIYALQKTIKKIMPNGAMVKVINYKQPKLESENNVVRFNSNDKKKDIIKNILYFPYRYFKRKSFKLFYKNYTNLTEEVTDLKQLKNYNFFIVGSDQVWNPDIHEYDTTYLLDVPGDVKKISYAASIGKDKLSIEEKKFFGEKLNDFKGISVRESNGVELLHDIYNKDISVTLDPTLLLTADEWRDIAQPTKKKEKYILVYYMQKNDQIDLIAQKLSKDLNLPIKYIMPRNKKYLDRISLKYTFGPELFLSLVDNSQFVITNSFHGTAFSVIFNKKFITVPHLSRGTRMIDLLTSLDLEDRIIRDVEELKSKNLLSAPNFRVANHKLEQLKIKSVKYLQENLLKEI